MKKEALAILNGKQSTTVNTLTQLMRLHQITCEIGRASCRERV